MQNLLNYIIPHNYFKQCKTSVCKKILPMSAKESTKVGGECETKRP